MFLDSLSLPRRKACDRLVPGRSLGPGVLSWRAKVPGGDKHTAPSVPMLGCHWCAALRAAGDLRMSQFSQPRAWGMAVPLAQRSVYARVYVSVDCVCVCVCVVLRESESVCVCGCVCVCVPVSVWMCVHAHECESVCECMCGSMYV